MIIYKRTIFFILMIYIVTVVTGCDVKPVFRDTPDELVAPSLDKQIKLIDSGPTPGGTLALFTTEVDTLNPYRTKNRYVTHMAFFIYESLFIQSGENEVTPWLVTHWEHNNHLQWMFTIQEGVRFHHGQELTAYDIRHTLRVLEKSGSPFYYIDIFNNIQEIQVINSTQFSVSLKQPDSFFVHKLVFPILPQTIESNMELTPGTGPYRFDSRDASEIRLTRNPRWWHEEPPYLETVVFKIYQENQMVDAFQNNELDIAFIKNVDFDKYQHRTDMRYQVFPDNEGNFLFVNPDSLFGKANRQEFLFRYLAHRMEDMNVGQVQFFDFYHGEPMDVDEFRDALIQSGLTWNRDRKIFTEQGRSINRLTILVPHRELEKLHTANFLVNILVDAGIQAEIRTANTNQEVRRLLRNRSYDLSPVTEELKPWESLADMIQRIQNDMGFNREHAHVLPLYRSQQAILFKNHIRGEKNSIYWNPYQGFQRWYLPTFLNHQIVE